MRLIPLCLLGLLAVALAPAAEAAPNRDGRAASASKSAKASSPARAAARPAAQPQRSASRQSAGNFRTVVARPGQLLRAPAKAQPSVRRAAPQRQTSWQAGLPVASGEQRECPVGTISTLARGHDDVVRCLPL